MRCGLVQLLFSCLVCEW